MKVAKKVCLILFIGDANGWKPEDMFAINEREYGVQSTYKSNLEGYTIQLDSNRNSKEYRCALTD